MSLVSSLILKMRLGVWWSVMVAHVESHRELASVKWHMLKALRVIPGTVAEEGF